jgi:hypothetical protein
MRPYSLCVVLLFVASWASAQEFPGLDAWRYGGGRTGIQGDGPRALRVVVAPDAARHVVGQSTIAAIDISVLGTDPGFRLRIPGVALTPQARLGLVGRGGVGLTSSGVGPTLGGGLRLEVTTWQDEQANEALMISGSLEAFGLFGRAFDPDSFLGPVQAQGDILFLATAADIAWVYEAAEHFGIQVGLNLGVAVSIVGTDADGNPTEGRFSLELHPYFGTRF